MAPRKHYTDPPPGAEPTAGCAEVKPKPVDTTDNANSVVTLVSFGPFRFFDAGDLTPLPPFTTMGEAVANDLAGVGIRTRVRTMERVTFLEAWRNKKLQGRIVNAPAAQGNAASPPAFPGPRRGSQVLPSRRILISWSGPSRSSPSRTRF